MPMMPPTYVKKKGQMTVYFFEIYTRYVKDLMVIEVVVCVGVQLRSHLVGEYPDPCQDRAT